MRSLPFARSTNFEHSGAQPYLYFTRSFGNLDRDLIRVPLTFAAH